MHERTSATGTYTFLLTDIEGSTLLWEQHGARMRAALEQHDLLLRAAIEACGGRVVKTTGDGMLAVFDAAQDALSAALAAQRALQAQTPAIGASAAAGGSLALKVRMGLHTGVADLRDGDYWGTSVNRAARIMSVAHGEQIVVSAATAQLVQSVLPADATLRDLGEHRLRGLLNPEHLLQVVAPGLRADFPALASQTAHSLPAERDAFVDRLEVLADLERRFAGSARLVSVLGVGGTGKTRFVTRFGWQALARFAGGVWFCDLAQARDVDGVVQAVAEGLDVPLGKDDPILQLGYAIAGRGACLVILDNFEQVARHAEDTVGRWLSRASQARFLVTTREVLGLPGEETLALAPLATTDASELFLRRAEAAKPGFAPAGEDAAAIGPLVRLLDGLPLAIELAAARVRVMPPRMLLARMTERFKLLATTGGRVDRQATLRAVFDWSWDLLSLPEKAALAQLSVFEGGFTLEAVESVLDVSAHASAPSPLDLLQSLVQKSLVRPVSDDRFELLVSVQDYAAEHLRTELRFAGSGPAARIAAEARHGKFFSSLREGASARDAFADLDNVMVACRRAAVRGDARMAARALQRAWETLKLRGPFQTAAELATAVGAVGGADAPTVARVNAIAGESLHYCGKTADARARLDASLASARAAGDRALEAQAFLLLGLLAGQEGRVDAMRDNLEAALAIADALGERALQARARNGLGQLNTIVGRPDEARTQYQAGLTLVREVHDRRLEAAMLANLAILYGGTGAAEDARAHAAAALAAAQETADQRVEANALCYLGLLQCLEGRLPDAQGSLEAALAMARSVGNANLEAVALCNLGMVRERVDDLAGARSQLDRALAIAREVGHKRVEGQVLGYLGLVQARQGELHEARERLESAAALLRGASDPESLGIVHALRGEVERLAGDVDASRDAIAAAAAIATDVSAGPGSELGVTLGRARRALTP